MHVCHLRCKHKQKVQDPKKATKVFPWPPPTPTPPQEVLNKMGAVLCCPHGATNAWGMFCPISTETICMVPLVAHGCKFGKAAQNLKLALMTMHLYVACCHAQDKHEATPLSHMRLPMQPHAPKSGTLGLFCSGPHLPAPFQQTFLVPIEKHPLRKLAKSLLQVLFNACWVKNSLMEMQTESAGS